MTGRFHILHTRKVVVAPTMISSSRKESLNSNFFLTRASKVHFVEKGDQKAKVSMVKWKVIPPLFLTEVPWAQSH